LGHPDTAPEIRRRLERRSPVRRVYQDFLVRAGSETGAPAAVAKDAPPAIRRAEKIRAKSFIVRKMLLLISLHDYEK
jgi:hypothetical protein